MIKFSVLGSQFPEAGSLKENSSFRFPVLRAFWKPETENVKRGMGFCKQETGNRKRETRFLELSLRHGGPKLIILITQLAA
jgi:hypothetical protein